MIHDLAALDAAISVEISPQPDDTTCGPTCLHAIYRYFGSTTTLPEIIGSVARLWHGGTLAVYLGCDALRRGFHARLYTFNLTVFDPTWFREPGTDLGRRLAAQAKVKPELTAATEAYQEFLGLGGEIMFQELNARLIRHYLKKEIPILTGLSATYLYGACREDPATCVDDDIAGEPAGHFVVLCGYDRKLRQILVADPYQENPIRNDHFYLVSADRMVGAILLGIITGDANMLVVWPEGEPA